MRAVRKASFVVHEEMQELANGGLCRRRFKIIEIQVISQVSPIPHFVGRQRSFVS